MNENLSAKIEIWKTINDFSNKIELSYQLCSTLLLSIIGALVAVSKDNLVPEKMFDRNFVILFFAPIVFTAIIGYLAYNFRWVAIARMYAAAIEKEINMSLDKGYFVWNSDIVNRFMAKNNFANRVFLPVVNTILIISTAVFLNYSIFCSTLYVYIKVAYLIFTALLYICSLIPFLGNEQVRKSEYKFKNTCDRLE